MIRWQKRFRKNDYSSRPDLYLNSKDNLEQTIACSLRINPIASENFFSENENLKMPSTREPCPSLMKPSKKFNS